MGNRREPRKPVRLPVRIFGTDASGRVFSENVFTVDVSREGARLTGVKSQINPGEIIGLTHGTNKGRFNVQWSGQPGTPQEGQLGLRNIAPEKPLWELPVPPPVMDSYSLKRTALGSERRYHPRLDCINSVQLQPQGDAAPIWGKALDLSQGGCFVEMPIPLPKGTKLTIGIWINQRKLFSSGIVVNSRPGYGIGVQFSQMSPEDSEYLRLYLSSIMRVR